MTCVPSQPDGYTFAINTIGGGGYGMIDLGGNLLIADSPRMKEGKLNRRYDVLGVWLRQVFIVVISSSAFVCEVGAERAFTIDDLLSNEQVGTVAISPTSDVAAVVVIPSLDECRRPVKFSDPVYYEDHVPPDACGAIHIVSSEDNIEIVPPSNLSGFFGPQWSPTGARLAFLSMDFDGEVHVWMWEHGAITRISRESIDLYLNVNADSGWDFRPFGWLDDDTVIFAVPGPSSSSSALVPTAHPNAVLKKARVAQATGNGTSASVLRSRITREDLPARKLVQVRLDKNNETQELASGAFLALHLSPTRKAALITEAIGNLSASGNSVFNSVHQNITPNSLQMGLSHSRVGFIDLDDPATEIAWFSEVYDMWTGRLPRVELGEETNRFAGPLPVWNRRGDQVAFLGRKAPYVDGASYLFVYDAGADKLSFNAEIGSRAISLAWSGNQVLYAQQVGRGSDCSAVWCAIAPNLTTPSREFFLDNDADRKVPPSIFAIGDELWFALDNSIWAAKTDTGHVRRLFEARSEHKLSIAGAGPNNRSILMLIEDGERFELRSLAIDNQGVHAKSHYVGESPGQIRAFGGPDGLIVSVVVKRQGTELLVVAAGEYRSRTAMSLNSHLQDVAVVSTEVLNYENRLGEQLSAVLVQSRARNTNLPAPLVVMVYPSAGFSSAARFAGVLNDRFFLSDALLPAEGYAVLYPEITVEPPDRQNTLCQQFVDDVIPAIDAAMSLDSVEGDRAAVIGFSFGGYVVNSLMTCSNRFAGGVAIAGFSDLFESYWRLPFPYRLTNHALNADFGFFRAERSVGGVFNLGVTPWMEPNQYLDNSPIFRADSLSAPLLLMHGEFDSVSIAHSEKMFMAGRRLGKDVTFVRYWGGGHMWRSPDNVRDLWTRILDFLERTIEEGSK